MTAIGSPQAETKQKAQPETRGKSEDDEDEKTSVSRSNQNSSETSRKLSRKNSRSSVTSSMNGEYRFAQELSETTAMKMFKMGWCLFAIALNCILLAFAIVSHNGMVVDSSPAALQSFGSLLVLFLLLIANFATVKALDTGYAALIAYWMSTVGQNLNLVGFGHQSSFMKIPFAFLLPSKKGGVKESLMFSSLLWVLLDVCKMLIIAACCYLTVRELRLDDGTISCIVFDQVGTEPFDRNWPTLEVQAGIGELVFGSSLGRMRSEEAVPETLMLMAPMLDGVVENGDTVVGPGFSVNVATKCVCSEGFDATSLSTAGIPAGKIADFSSLISANLRQYAMINYVSEDPQQKEAYVDSAFLGSKLCGDPKTTSKFPVCKTKFHSHNKITSVMKYMTDGTTASIAQEDNQLRSVDGTALMYPWGFNAVKSVVGDGVQLYKVPLVKAAADSDLAFQKLNPLDYWTNGELYAVNEDRFSAGVENLFALVFRAGIQRTYSTEGQTCTRNVRDPKRSVLIAYGSGYDCMMAATIIQIIVAAISAVAFVPWLRSDKVPLGPAYRAFMDKSYFMALIAESDVADGLKGFSNAPKKDVLEVFDQTVMIGESMDSKEDDIGHITLGKPEKVIPLLNLRKYN